MTTPPPLYPYGIATDFTVTPVSGNLWLLRNRTEIEQTGAAVTTTYKIPFPHKIHWIQIIHTDGDNALSTDAMAFQYLSELNYPGLYVEQYATAANTTGMIFISFRDEAGRIYGPTNHRFVTNTTNGHHVWFNALTEVLKD